MSNGWLMEAFKGKETRPEGDLVSTAEVEMIAARYKGMREVASVFEAGIQPTEYNLREFNLLTPDFAVAALDAIGKFHSGVHVTDDGKAVDFVIPDDIMRYEQDMNPIQRRGYTTGLGLILACFNTGRSVKHSLEQVGRIADVLAKAPEWYRLYVENK